MHLSDVVDKRYRPYNVFSLVLCLVMVVIEVINKKFYAMDFCVYYYAAEAFLNGTSVYGVPFPPAEVGYYKYSPFTILFFVPYTLVTVKLASIIHYLIISACAIFSVFISYSIFSEFYFKKKFKRVNLILVGLFLIITLHLVRELLLGNINTVLMVLFLIALWALLKEKFIQAGFILGIAILAKPYLVIALIPLLAHKKWKPIIAVMLTFLLSALTVWIFTGIERTVDLYQNWMQAMITHNNYIDSHHTIESILRYHFSLSTGYLFKYLILLFPFIIFLMVYFMNKRRVKNIDNQPGFSSRAFIIEYFIMIAIIPSVFITDSQQFLFSLPLITFLLLTLIVNRSVIWWIIFVVLMFFYGGNSTDLLGHDLSMKIHVSGLLGISNIAILLLTIYFSTFRTNNRFV